MSVVLIFRWCYTNKNLKKIISYYIRELSDIGEQMNNTIRRQLYPDLYYNKKRLTKDREERPTPTE